MQVEVHVEGRSVTELEANARKALDAVADGRTYTFTVDQAHGSAGSDFPSPLSRMSAGYGGPRLSGYVSATFADKGATS